MLSWLRYPLALLIVFIHTGYPTDNPTEPAYYIGKLLSEGVAVIAVPTFFFISGYLFFAKYKTFGWTEYASAMRRKFFSLAVPYIIWIALIYYSYGFYSGQLTGINLSPSELYKIFWAFSDGYVVTSIFGYKFSILSFPSGAQGLWFVRDLMVAMLLSPIIWCICKRCKLWSIILFLIPYFLYIGIPIQGFGLTALCFFPIGAALSINGVNLLELSKRCGKYFLIAFTILLSTKYILDILHIHYSYYNRILLQLVICTGIVAALSISHYMLRYTKSAEIICKLGEASFFIYIFHSTPLFLLLNPIITWLSNSLWGGVLAYFFSWGFRVFACTALYFLMKKICPTLLSILVGGRVSKPCVSGNDISLANKVRKLLGITRR
jgi:fucose 4-O-acetylase-like acetyltransferase